MLLKTLILLTSIFLGIVSPSIARGSENSLFISHDAYALLSIENRTVYIKRIRQYFAELESDTFPGKPIALEQLYFDQLIGSAQAAEFCMMGGTQRPFINQKCSSFGNGCSAVKDGFQCGTLFASACIDRMPVDSVSQRCFLSSLEKPLPTPDEYSKIKLQAETDFKTLCQETGRAETPACTNFTAKMADLKNKMAAPAKAGTVPAKPTMEATTANPIRQIADWANVTFRRNIDTLADIKKLTNENEDQAVSWAKTCNQDRNKDLPAKAISIQFPDGESQNNIPVKMLRNTDGSWTITLAQGRFLEDRVLKTKNGIIYYVNSEGEEMPVKIHHIHPREMNFGVPIGYNGTNACLAFQTLAQKNGQRTSGSKPAGATSPGTH